MEQSPPKVKIPEVPRPEPPKTEPNDSYTQEDLIETLQDIKAVIDLLLHRAKSLQQLVYQETQTQLLEQDYEHEGELKYLVYRVLVELKHFFVIFCCKTIVGKETDFAPLASKVGKLGIQPSMALRVYTN